MNAIQLPFFVEAVLIGICALFGILLGRTGKPYGKIKLALHLFFYAWLTFGFAFIYVGALKEVNPTLIPATIMGVMILVQLGTGVLMMTSKTAGRTLSIVHMTSAAAMLVADIVAFVIAGIR